MTSDPQKTYALVVGIEDYGIKHWNNLDGPVPDAHRFTTWLQQNGVPTENILLRLSPRASNAELAISAQPATRQSISDALTTLSQKSGDLLFIFWSGHGMITADGERRLFYADVTEKSPLNLDLHAQLTTLRSDIFAGFVQQICIIDACANYMDFKVGALPHDIPAHGKPRPACQQFIVMGAKAGDFAINLTSDKTGIFAKSVLDLLEKETSQNWPPDFVTLTKTLQHDFTELRNLGKTKQTPNYFWFRDWDNNEFNLGTIINNISIESNHNQNILLHHYLIEFKKYTNKFTDHQIYFDISFKDIDNKKTSTDNLIQWVIDKKRVILHGVAGGGKTSILIRTAKIILSSDFIPIFLNFKKWNPEHYEQLNFITKKSRNLMDKLDIILKTSITDINLKILNSISMYPKFIIVDGLNEIYGQEIVRQILDILSEYVRNNTNSCVIISDRMTKRMREPWNEIYLDNIEENEIKNIINKKSINKSYNFLSSNEKRILETPYFLDHWINNITENIVSKSKFIESFFVNQLNLNNEEIDNLSTIAYNGYKNNKSLLIDKDNFLHLNNLYSKFLESNVLIEVDSNYVQFDHQLKHDYLVSHYLVKHSDDWGTESFDIATFQSNSFDVLTMVLDQLSSPNLGDRFLGSVYDWNWSASIVSMIEAANQSNKPYSFEMEVFILATVASKLFDPILSTQNTARDALKKLPSHIIKSIINAKDEMEIIEFVSSVNSNNKWFMDWKNIFIRTPVKHISEKEINKITNPDPKIAWTASNVIRRFTLNNSDLLQLRTIYYTSSMDIQRDNSIRWRVVHSLGTTWSHKSIDLLLYAIDNDFYNWTRYGATRSLIELAAKCNKKDQQYILKQLKDRVSILPPMIQNEIGRAVFYDKTGVSWDKTILDLLYTIQDSQQDEVDIDRWKSNIQLFQNFLKGVLKT